MAGVIFPREFRWGVATASYQIEGAVNEDGRGESIWDRFSHTPGKIHGADNGDTACDHYHRFREDISTMKDMGLQTYRFSIAWPRILPDGKGKINRPGLDFYGKLVDTLLENDIEPAATIYHWDLPQALQDRGGWVNRDTADYYTEYACTLFDRLGDRIKFWITHNEPWVAAFLGYEHGVHAPGLRDRKKALSAAHHILLSHAKTVEAYQEFKKSEGRIGITLDMRPIYPASDSTEDRQAAVLADGYHNRWFLDPVFHGAYPADMVEYYKNSSEMAEMRDGDLELMKRSRIDFLGVNYYSRHIVKSGGSKVKVYESAAPEESVTDMGWEVFPEGLYTLLKRLDEDYDHPDIYITENGAAYQDNKVVDGRIEDDDRIEYLREHFEQACRLIREGVSLKGYYIWTLMDNFEWSFGYSKRFGLIHTNYQTQARTWKKSAFWLRDVISNNGF